MKKLFILMVVIIIFSMGSGIVLAQGQQVNLPSAGLTPDSLFYFLDCLGENLRQFFSFNPDAKAKLQIEFAGERVAEIKILVEKKDPNNKAIERAKELLLSSVAYAAELVNQEKASGKDVSQLAKDLDDEFDSREELLMQAFLEAREKLLVERKEIKERLLKDAQTAGDTAKVAELTQQLNDIQDQADILKVAKDEIKKDLQTEKEKIEQEMDEEDRQKDDMDQNQQDQEEQEQEEQIEDEETPEPEEALESEESAEVSEVGEFKNEEEKKLELNADVEQEQPGSQTQGTGAKERE